MAWALVGASVERAFDFANAAQANANQVGLFDMGDDDHGSSTQEPGRGQLTTPIPQMDLHGLVPHLGAERLLTRDSQELGEEAPDL